MIVTNQEMEIIELLRDTMNDMIKEKDLINNIAHDRYITKRLLMSLKCKEIVYTVQIKNENNQLSKWIVLEEEYQDAEQ